MDGNARFLNEAAVCQARWEPTGLLEGVGDRFTRSCTSVLLENQRLMNETATDTSDVANFKRISIPLVRRIYPQLIANKVVSVQPLLGPVGLVYYLRFRYGSDKGATLGASNAGFPSDDANSLMQKASGDANLDVYFSSSFVQNETSASDAGGASTTVFDPLKHTPIFAGSMTGTLYESGSAVQTFSVSEAGTFTFVDIGTPTVKGTAVILSDPDYKSGA